MKQKVVVKLMGGLGNQMLQFATGFALAQKLNATLFLDTSYYKISHKKGDTPRAFELEHFNVAYKSYKHPIISNYIAQMFFGKYSHLRKYILPLFGIKYLTDADQLGALEIKAPLVYLDGYWQSNNYFNAQYSNIVSAFTLKENLQLKLQNFLNGVAGRTAVAVHIRRTDYLLPHSSHHVLDVQYYNAAINYIKQLHPQAVFYFFGDDHHWIKENFDIDGTIKILVNENFGSNSYLDLTFMSACQHIIISNSTFSWWAAYLNQNSDKIIIAPQKWFLPGKSGGFNYDSFIPNHWIKI